MKKIIMFLLVLMITITFTSCKTLPQESSSAIESNPSSFTSIHSELESSEPTTSNEEKDIVFQEETASSEASDSESTVSKPVSSHKHSYTQKVVKATCEKGGYTQYTCRCGESYKDDETYELGHLYTEWKVIKKATTKSTGLKECKCDKCGGATLTEIIPKKKKVANIDSRVEIGEMKLTKSPQYTLKKANLIDKRTWGETPTITVTDGDCMHVVYYNKKGEKVEFDVEQPIVEDTINGYTILEDGTYVGDYFGAFS